MISKPFNNHVLNAPIKYPYTTNNVAPTILIKRTFLMSLTKKDASTNNVAVIPITSYSNTITHFLKIGFGILLKLNPFIEVIDRNRS